MKKVFILFLSGLLAFGAASDLCAQDFETGYFLGGNPYAFRLNPAFQSERGIFSIGLGQTGVGTWRNLVAHLLWEQGVKGSNPLVPTIWGLSSAWESVCMACRRSRVRPP